MLPESFSIIIILSSLVFASFSLCFICAFRRLNDSGRILKKDAICLLLALASTSGHFSQNHWYRSSAVRFILRLLMTQRYIMVFCRYPAYTQINVGISSESWSISLIGTRKTSVSVNAVIPTVDCLLKFSTFMKSFFSEKKHRTTGCWCSS